MRPPWRDDSKRVPVREPTSAREAYHAWGAGFDVDPPLDRLCPPRAHVDRVRPFGEREPALLERVGGQPEAAVQIDRGPVPDPLELDQAVAGASLFLGARLRSATFCAPLLLRGRGPVALFGRRRGWVAVYGIRIGRPVRIPVGEERIDEDAAADEDTRSAM